MKQFFSIAAIAAIAIEFSSPVMAVSITETTDYATMLGGSLVNVGTMELGTNDVNGEMNGSCSGGLFCVGGPDRQDGFLFDIAAGHQLTSLFVGSDGFGPTGFTWNAQLRDNISYNVFETIVAPVNGSGSMSGFGSLGAGTYVFNINSFQFSEPGDFGMAWSAGFTVESTMSTVPLPAGAPLLATGLVIIAGLRRRRHKS